MMRVRVIAGTLAALMAPAGALARDYEVDLELDSLEDLYDLQASGDLESDSVEILEAMFQRPLNVNRADRFLLYDLPDVTYELADAIIAYRAEHGAYESLEDLAAVEGMDAKILASIAPFATVGVGGELPVEASPTVRGDAKVGSIVRKGFGRNPDEIDDLAERERGPQAYLRLRGTGFTYLGAGALVTFRRRMDAWWDYSRGALVSDGPRNVPDIDNAYIFGGYAGWSIILGSYTAGFGERLTFDTTTRAQPHGWYENDTVTQDNESGSVDSRPGQFGVAATMHGANIANGWLDATVFGSWVREDLYQYDYNYGHDEWYGSSFCDTDSDCPFGYVCRDDHVCSSTRVYPSDDPTAPGYRYETHRDAYDERLMGGNATFNFDERSHVGVTGYYSMAEFNLAGSVAEPAFAYAARMPRRFDDFFAAGLDARFGLGPVELGAEYARTTGDGNAAYLRAVIEPVPWVELTASARYYDANYLNPHSRPRAQRDELYGLAGRNEVGGRIDATIKPISRLRLVTKVDLWGNPWIPEFDDQGNLTFAAKQEVPLDLFAAQRVTWGFTSREEASVVFEYRNKDLSENGRDETYDLGDFCDEGVSESNCGRGESRKLQVRVATTRLPRTRVWASYTAAWEDISRYDDKFDLQHRVRVHGRVDAWDGARLVLHLGLWFHNKELENVDPDYPFSDREEPRSDSYFELQQKIGKTLALKARYGLINYKDTRAERYSWYHLGKLTVEARF
jgi:hypothetical protein